jgi:flavin-dependent dehydrogenase
LQSIDHCNEVTPTTSFDFDIVVVGASFAGGACAIAAAQRGLRVCVVERKLDPGDKLRTTGIIVKDAAEQTLLNQIPSTMTRRIEQVRLYAPSLRQVALAAPGYYFLTTDTPKVMRWLAEQLRLHGVDLRLGIAFNRCARSGEGWHVEGVGSTRYLVGADGARSRVAQRCGLGEVKQFLYGIEYEFPVPASPTTVPCTASSASAMHPATSAGSRRTRPACRPASPCGTIRRMRAFPTSMASCCGLASRAAYPGTSSPGTRVPA